MFKFLFSPGIAIFMTFFLCACANNGQTLENTMVTNAMATNAMATTTEMGPVEHTVLVKGIVIDTKPDKNQVSISHGPIPEMNWPPMLMEFSVDNDVSITGFKKGDSVNFELEIDQNKNYRLKSIEKR